MQFQIMLLASFLCLLPVTKPGGQCLTIEISNVKSTSGIIRLAFFTDSQSFEDEKPQFEKLVSKESLSKEAITVHYTDIPRGIYGIALLDDENRNGKMDYRCFIPTEGFGFSGYEHTGMRKPAYGKFSFQYDGKQKTISIKVKYLTK